MVLSDIHRSLVQIRLEGVFVVVVRGQKHQVCIEQGVNSHLFLNSLVVRISACHVEGLGSIPSWGEIFLVVDAYFAMPGWPVLFLTCCNRLRLVYLAVKVFLKNCASNFG